MNPLNFLYLANVLVMLKIFQLLFLSILSLTCFGQKYIKPFIGLNFSDRLLSSEFSQRKDSLNQSDKIKAFPTAGVQFLFEKEPGREVYVGVVYSESGFVRERFNYKFRDTVHPELGQIFDLSQGADKNVFFTYRFKYVEIPLGFNFQFTPRQYMNTFTGWFNAGLTPSLLIKQNMTIFLEGFSMKGKNRFKFDETGYGAAKFNLAFQTGSRFDIKLNSKLWVTLDALFRIHLLKTASNSNENLRLVNLSGHLGLRYEVGNY